MPDLSEFWIFLLVGFGAQLIDGALGMGYGVISSVVLLASGVPPAHTSASVHSAKLFTTAASGMSHLFHGNVDRRLFLILAIAGSAGGIAGAFFLTQVSGKTIRPYVFGYLLIMGLLILWRCWREGKERQFMPGGFVGPLGGLGGLSRCGGRWRLGTGRDLEPDRRRRQAAPRHRHRQCCRIRGDLRRGRRLRHHPAHRHVERRLRLARSHHAGRRG